MIRKLFIKVTQALGRRRRNTGEPAMVRADRHGVHKESLSSGSRRVVEGLQAKGYTAYIVGGAVRDMLLGREPKDFDVATNATPEQVRQVFRRSRIIGRRFQIVHVMMGAETIEVTTFRGAQDNVEKDAHGRILRDNAFGTIADDAARRDFTVNALYYDPGANVIVDYHHGVGDLEQRTLRIIGEPRARYREDPVRMLRAVRFAAKLGLAIDPAARGPIREMADLLQNVPSARLFDEMLKLLTSGYAVQCIEQLRGEGLHHGLLPLLDVILEQPAGERFVMLALARTDERVRQGRPISPGFLFATLLWHEVLARWNELRSGGTLPTIPALQQALDDTIDRQCEKLAITRRVAGDIKELLALQPRFEQRSGKRPLALLEQPRFKAAYDFVLLRAEAGEVPSELADWWTRFIAADPDERAGMLLPQAADPARKRRSRRPRKRRTDDGPPSDAPGPDRDPE